MEVSWPSVLLGVIVGFILGVLTCAVLHRKSIPGDHALAWTLSMVWLSWHVLAGIDVIANQPPFVFDIVSGGSVGFILGERFWQGVKFLRK